MFKAVEYTAGLFDSLLSLIKEQAHHHGTTFGGNPIKLRDEFGKAGAHTKAFFIEHDSAPTPVGLGVIHELHTPEGRGLYLEDLYISETFRNSVRGTGSYAFGHLIQLARDEGYDYVNWMVAEDNDEHTFKFYLKKCQAVEEDLTMLSLSKKFDLASVAPQTRYNTTIDKTGPGNYRLSLRDKDGAELAGAYMNENYSTFRTISGLRIEPDLPQSDKLSANDNLQDIYDAIHRRVIEFARDSGNTGHIVWAVPKEDTKLEQFLITQGLQTYRLDENAPETRLIPFRIGRADIDSNLMDRLQNKTPPPAQQHIAGLNQG